MKCDLFITLWQVFFPFFSKKNGGALSEKSRRTLRGTAADSQRDGGGFRERWPRIPGISFRQGIFFTTFSNSSMSKALMVRVVTFPWEPRASAKAAAASSSWASVMAT